MTPPPFAHLHCHSDYSLLDGVGTIPALLRRTKELGMNSLALTDHGNMYGALAFYRTAKEMGIHPIVGMEGYIAPGSRFDKKTATDSEDAAYHITLLAQNRTGFQNLLKLTSLAFLEGLHFYPRFDRELLAAHNNGLICLSGCTRGELNRNLLDSNDVAMTKARETAAWYQKVFGDRYFIEIQCNGLETQRIAREKAIDLARSMGLPLVATSDVHYVLPEDADAQDILLCINKGTLRSDANRPRRGTNGFYLRSPEEMLAALPVHEEALKRSQEIADRCQLDLDLGKRHFPVYGPSENKSPEEYLRELCVAGLKERFRDQPSRFLNGTLSDEVQARLDQELSVINKLGAANYFLILWDLIRFTRSQNIPSTARGSCAGSLVAYALYLSHVCPLSYGLFFERFLDENSAEMPEIYIDFCWQRRAEVIQYLKKKYGVDKVAKIGIFCTVTPRSAIRDVGHALGMSISRVDAILETVRDELGITVHEALEKSCDLKRLCDVDPEVRDLFALAMKVEGLACNVETQAAAVVISDRPLMDDVPVQIGGNKEVITQWAMDDIGRAGLLKMNVLGLRGLTIMAAVIDLIERKIGKKIDPNQFPLDDSKTFALLCRGDTKGIFQIQSDEIRDLLRQAMPNCLGDMIALYALYRPGPVAAGMVDEYVLAKSGDKNASCEHVVVGDILDETRGVMVYDEQLMQIFHRLGGIALVDGYRCIKAIRENDEDMIARFQKDFIEGAGEQNITKAKAEKIFEQIKRFAGCTFNKAHSAAYSLINYQMAYLKAHYPTEFKSCVG